MGKPRHTQQGFTLIEIAIVLVIIGLLLGGVLKGQELITSARVRNLISQQDGIKAAFYGFQDRFRAIPGDYNQAQANITCTPACTNGDGNGQIRNTTDTPAAAIDETNAVWEHLSRAGFINGSYTYNAGTPTPQSTPSNPYSMFLEIHYDQNYAGSPTMKHNLKSGNQIPGDIIGEVDRKVDDGRGESGGFRFSAYSATGTAPTAALCYQTAAGPNQGNWIVAGTIETNCGGTSLF